VDLVFGNEGNDSIFVFGGNDTAFGGLGNDSIRHENGAAIGNPLLFGNEGNDTIDTRSAVSATVVGGNDSADGNDSIIDGVNTALIFGNGGNDTVDNGTGNDTAIGGFGNDCINDSGGIGNNLIFLNEGNDTYAAVGQDGTNTVFGGLGNDSIRLTVDALAGNRDTIQGNEGNDTIRGHDAVDTISGGSGNDVFAYSSAIDDGDNATGGGPVEFITDVDFSVDKFQTTPAITFATNTGAGTGVDLATSANNALNSAAALAGVQTVAAQFTFSGRTYLAINIANAGFLDTDDLLLDITGATGSIGAGNFI
jgi:Ca2+-binding RTX toxin-like protein